jgi:hypothetical protein
MNGDSNFNRRSLYGGNSDDQDEFRFGNRSRHHESNAGNDESLKQLQERIAKSENESLESTYRSLRVLNETCDIGVHTASELVRQGEKLDKVEETMNSVNSTLTSTQKNLNQIRSIFGGWTNRFFRCFLYF